MKAIEIFNNGDCVVDCIEGTIIEHQESLTGLGGNATTTYESKFFTDGYLNSNINLNANYNKTFFILNEKTKEEFVINIDWDIPLRVGHYIRIFRIWKITNGESQHNDMTKKTGNWLIIENVNLQKRHENPSGKLKQIIESHYVIPPHIPNVMGDKISSLFICPIYLYLMYLLFDFLYDCFKKYSLDDLITGIADVIFLIIVMIVVILLFWGGILLVIATIKTLTAKIPEEEKAYSRTEETEKFYSNITKAIEEYMKNNGNLEPALEKD